MKEINESKGQSKGSTNLKMIQEKEAKRRKYLTFGLVIAILLGFLVLVSTLTKDSPRNKESSENDKSNNSEMTASDVKENSENIPSYLTTDGSFRVTEDGAIDTDADDSPKDGKLRVEVFFDPMCPGCGIFDRSANDLLMRLVNAGEIDLYMVPVAFLDSQSSDDYSTRAVNAIATVATESPEHFNDFIHELYKEENQPSEGSSYEPQTDNDLIVLAEKVGMPSEDAKKISDQKYVDWVAKNTEFSMGRTDLFPDGKFGTPSIFFGGAVSPEGRVTGVYGFKMQNPSTIAEDLERAIGEIKEHETSKGTESK